MVALLLVAIMMAQCADAALGIFTARCVNSVSPIRHVRHESPDICIGEEFCMNTCMVNNEQISIRTIL